MSTRGRRGERRRLIRLVDERGSVSAELAVAMPAVLVVLALCLAVLQVASQQVRYADAAAVGARSLARGESAAVAAGRALAVAGPGEFSHTERGEFVCTTVSGDAAVVLGQVLGVQVSAASCALRGGL
ncbi:MAG: TadE family type IV pilus minor pilin [Naasia sp.]